MATTTYRKKVVLPSDKDETQVQVKIKQVPKFQDKEAVVKLNTAAILREEARLKKQKEEEATRMKALLTELRDSTDFKKWQDEMKQKDDLQKQEQLQIRKIEMEMARDAAVEACQQKLFENQIECKKMKEEAAIGLQEAEDKAKQDFQKRQQVVEDIQARRVVPEQERQKVVQKNKEIRDEMIKDITEAIQRRKEEDKVEQAKRDELIRQIREIERQPIKRTKGFDPTEIMGFGLLEEMSIVQLKERLTQVKLEQEKKIEEQRIAMQLEKEKKALELEEKTKIIADARIAQNKQKMNERILKQHQKQQKELKKQQIKEKGLLEVHAKIADKKQKRQKEQQKLAKELREIKIKRQFLNANRAMVEENAWKEQEKGAEREIKGRQNKKLTNQARIEQIKLQETNLRLQQAKSILNQKGEFLSDYQQRMTEAEKDKEVIIREERLEKQLKHTRQVEFENKHKKNIEDRNPYAAKVNNASVSNAKTWKQNKTQNRGF